MDDAFAGRVDEKAMLLKVSTAVQARRGLSEKQLAVRYGGGARNYDTVQHSQCDGR